MLFDVYVMYALSLTVFQWRSCRAVHSVMVAVLDRCRISAVTPSVQLVAQGVPSPHAGYARRTSLFMTSLVTLST